MKIGNRKYLLCDSTKIGTKTVCSYAKIGEFDILFTDDQITPEERKSIEEQSVTVR